MWPLLRWSPPCASDGRRKRSFEGERRTHRLSLSSPFHDIALVVSPRGEPGFLNQISVN